MFDTQLIQTSVLSKRAPKRTSTGKYKDNDDDSESNQEDEGVDEEENFVVTKSSRRTVVVRGRAGFNRRSIRKTPVVKRKLPRSSAKQACSHLYMRRNALLDNLRNCRIAPDMRVELTPVPTDLELDDRPDFLQSHLVGILNRSEVTVGT